MSRIFSFFYQPKWKIKLLLRKWGKCCLIIKITKKKTHLLPSILSSVFFLETFTEMKVKIFVIKDGCQHLKTRGVRSMNLAYD